MEDDEAEVGIVGGAAAGHVDGVGAMAGQAGAQLAIEYGAHRTRVHTRRGADGGGIAGRSDDALQGAEDPGGGAATRLRSVERHRGRIAPLKTEVAFGIRPGDGLGDCGAELLNGDPARQGCAVICGDTTGEEGSGSA